MRIARCLILVVCLAGESSIVAWAQDARATTPGLGSNAAAAVFLVKPYLQWGDAASRGTSGLVVLWHTHDEAANWSVEYRPGADRPWRNAEAPTMRRIAVPGIPLHRLYRVALKDLVPGDRFSYRLSQGRKPVFQAEGMAPKASGQPYRFVAFGDCAAGTPEQKAIAYRAYLERPDFVVIPGDIVYSRGRISEYREKFWPVYNADEASPSQGAPMLRSTVFLAAPGNHDIGTRDLDKYPDGLAYFLYWNQPLNGPSGGEGSSLVPPLKGSEAHRKAFLDAAGTAYPRMANFSFDYANAHWTVLDSNPYVDWSEPDLHAWVEHDLAAARSATWRFVTFHHPGLHSSKEHFEQQQMRLLAEVFEKGGVDLVVSGHVHNYQRTFPMHFVANKGPDGRPVREKNLVAGHWTLDKSFDSRDHTHPNGVIYLVTGAGGQHLYNPEQQDDPASWQSFTDKFVSKVNSLTVVDVRGRSLTVRQLSGDGRELDHFTVEKR
jgi:acid phosphatase type 7